MTSWTDDAAAWIASQRKAHAELSNAELEKHCRKNYPYAMRKGWAYKAWLKAMTAYFRPQAVRPVRNGQTQPSTEELEKRGQYRLID